MPFTKTFTDPGTFAATHAAEKFLEAHGYSVGTMCNDLPRGVKHGDYDIAKWRNLSDRDQRQMDGTLEGDHREGPVTLRLFKGLEGKP